ncbi:MAG: hypothetical protein J6O61_12940 [Butyrivibrio sp.]|uniref:hypothetical protein n=1 Tax=Butyrivibrio sp. TaxID=28121 RepID=UPI001B28DCF4|nr:hypothetical protein [Butyrivibrio sp.]MBO6241725.1 hypothetical protein [Butyrivibrio sp.]
MGDFVLRDYKFTYIDENSSKEVLLNLNDYLSNRGRIPFHSEFTNVTIPNIILRNMEMHESICGKNSNLIKYESYYSLIDVLFIREHIRNKFPKYVIQIGASDDVLSTHIKNIAKELHPETKYEVIYDLEELIKIQSKADIIFLYGSIHADSSGELENKFFRILKPNGWICALCKKTDVFFEMKNWKKYYLGADLMVCESHVSAL